MLKGYLWLQGFSCRYFWYLVKHGSLEVSSDLYWEGCRNDKDFSEKGTPNSRRQLAQSVSKRNHGSWGLLEILDDGRRNKCFIHLQKCPKEWSRELQASQAHFSFWENHQASPLGTYFCAHERSWAVSFLEGIQNLFRKHPYEPRMTSYLSLLSTGSWPKWSTFQSELP